MHNIYRILIFFFFFFREEQHLAILMAIMAICFIITMIPSILLEFLYHDYENMNDDCLLFRAFAAVTELCNFAAHIIIYFSCSKEFRKEFLKILQVDKNFIKIY